MSTDTTKRIELIRSRLVPWFKGVARNLPWRRTRDPYRIWLSEVMLQQTRVDQAESYYHRFVERYPTVGDLAAADLDRVLRDWEGLGYYARARNMHRAAQMIVREMGGEFPSRHADLLSLPGVGAYTAAAVASIAFEQPYAVVDGNVVRVISRLFEVADDPAASRGRKRFQSLADELLDPANPSAFNEAMMELGATVCLPRNPACGQCPVLAACTAYERDRVDELPFRRPRKPLPHHEIAVAIILDAGKRVFIQRRAEDGLLGGLWEFPGGKIEDGESAPEACRREVLEELGVEIVVGERLETVDHAYSHFTIRLHGFVCSLRGADPLTSPTALWAPIEDLSEYAFPRANRRLIQALLAGQGGDSGPAPNSALHS